MALTRLLEIEDVMKAVGLSRGTIWSLRRTNEFPAPVQLSANRIAWRESDVEAWMANLQPAEVKPPVDPLRKPVPVNVDAWADKIASEVQ